MTNPRRHTSPRGPVTLLALLVMAAMLAGAFSLSQEPAHGEMADTPVMGDAAAPPPTDASARTAAPQRLVFSDDFEAYGDSSRWSHDHPFEVKDDVVSSGLYAARLTNTGGVPVYGQRRLQTAYSSLYARIDFQVITPPAGQITLLQLKPSRGTSVVAIQIDATGHISYTTGATGITSRSASSTSFGEWHRLQVYVDTTSQEGNLRIWLDEAELTTMRQDAYLGDRGVALIEIGDNRTGTSGDIAVDNVLVDDAFIPAAREADPVSGTLHVRAIPAWAGIVFEIDGETFTTGPDGTARIEIKRWSTDLRSRITVHDATQDNARISFTGWREWLSPHSNEVYATFALWEPISLTFVDMYGVPVDASAIQSVVIKSSTGDIYTFNTEDLLGQTLLISSVQTSPTGVHVKPITYYVDQVTIGGANVVNRSQQQTTFEGSPSWTITLLLYQVKFQAVDALFGSPVGKEIAVESPDGSVTHLALDDNGTAMIPRLPRGDYDVYVVGSGYSPPRPIRISRDQVVQLEVISHLDALLAIGMASSVGMGLVIAGRPHLVTRPISYLAGLQGLRWPMPPWRARP